jgi:hypothetical protein
MTGQEVPEPRLAILYLTSEQLTYARRGLVALVRYTMEPAERQALLDLMDLLAATQADMVASHD